MTIADVFGAEGLLAQQFAGYQPRKGQVDMASAVDLAIERGHHALIDAPTGTGKSLAYLAPAIQRAKAKREKVIVVTGNIALQEQLVEKDLPLLAKILPEKFTFALAKGKNNYLCQSNLGKTLAEGILGGDPMLTRIIAWAQQTETGDISEFPDVPPAQTWRKLSVISEECKGAQCSQHADCFAEKAKAKVFSADVIVTNYHMFFAHLVVRAKMRENARARGQEAPPDVVLPEAAIVIFDEAHKAADIARDFLGFQLGLSQIEFLTRGVNTDQAKEVWAEAQSFFREVADLKRSPRYRSRLRKGQHLAGERLHEMLIRFGEFYRDFANKPEYSQEQAAELHLRARRCVTLADNLKAVVTLRDDKDVVYFLEESERGKNTVVTVKSKPIFVAGFLREELFAEYRTVILTSATLASGSGSSAFAFVKKEIGCDKAFELCAESPFTWKDQVLLVLPQSMTDPSNREYFGEAVAEHVVEACEQADGRTLGLFTSYRNMTQSAEYLKARRFRHRVLTQKDGPRTKLVQQFKEDTHSVLLGCESFWAGIDVPGESLSCVVIDRLPFPTPDDPIIDAISERDPRGWFTEYAVPRAIIQVKQGFGRLIRSVKDRGCVVILDRRIFEKGYGRQFLKALPSTMASNDMKDISKFLEMA